MRATIDLPITVTATDRATMDSGIDDAVAVARMQAMQEGRRGILITRHDYGSFTVDLSDAVPYGLTLERRDW